MSAIENYYDEVILRLQEKLASAQRGKEAAERSLASITEHAERCASLLKLEATRTEQLQQERNRLAARLDAAEHVRSHLELWRSRATTSRNWDRGEEVDLLGALIAKLEDALSSSTSTSAVAEGEK